MEGNSRPVFSNQTGPHPDLKRIVCKHLGSDFHYPISESVLEQFNHLHAKVQALGMEIILDSGCGTGQSTRQLAEDHPNQLVIGVDKSAHRLAKANVSEAFYHTENLIFLQMDLISLWLLASRYQWRLEKHFVLYPNPWPKQHHFQRRWHGHAIFPSLVKLGGYLTVCTNWPLYLVEMQTALALAGKSAHIQKRAAECRPISLFQKKYAASGHPLMELCCLLE